MSQFDLSDAVWRISSHSGANEGNCIEVAAVWRISSYSGADEGSCVEVGGVPAERAVATRDSRDRSGPVLTFSQGEWASFLDAIKSGELDL